MKRPKNHFLAAGALVLAAFSVLTVACSRKMNLPPVTPDPPATDTAQPVRLSAGASGSAYTLINNTWGGTAVETPDCIHPQFGDHIRQEFNAALNKNVFAFYVHVQPDNDRCINTDRQRVEIKTYNQSPDKLKAFKGDTMTLHWKFFLDENFQPSPSFTHLHQIKPFDGDASMPMITLTARYKSSGDLLEVIHVDSKGTRTVMATTSLSSFKGHWVDVEEKLVFNTSGFYQLKVYDGPTQKQILAVSRPAIDLWRNGTTFCRPKWGIYRSLNQPGYLRDEKVLFADFCIAKGNATCN